MNVLEQYKQRFETMSNQSNLVSDLTFRLETITLAEAATESIAASIFSTRQIQASVLSKFARFLADNADLMPSKEIVLDALSKAIDLAFTALGRPVIANLLKPVVKQQILNAAGAMYDNIFSAEPRTEV
jgi:hypothetical protein